MNTPLLNRQKCRAFALAYAAKNRAHRFDRVSAEFLEAIDADTRAAIRRRIQSHPSKGKTLK